MGRKAQHLVSAFCPKPSPTVEIDGTDVSLCCAATHELAEAHGTGRLLAVLGENAADALEELPQVHSRAFDEYARFRINKLNATTLMRHIGGRTHHGHERADLVCYQEEPREEMSRHVARKCREEGAQRLCEGGPERHLLRHWREHRRRVLFAFLKLLCKEGIKVQYMTATVDDYIVQQLKDLNGKKSVATKEEGG